MGKESTASDFIADLRGVATEAQKGEVQQFFTEGPGRTEFLGVSIGKIFPVAKRHQVMALGEIETLLDDPRYEVRMGAAAIMDFQARGKGVSEAHRKALFDLYIGRHERIDNWDLVDRAAPHVVGGYLADRSRDVLYALARSANPWERRTAIVATYFFIRAGDARDTLAIAEILVADSHELVRKAVGSWLRAAGDVDGAGLRRFLDAHAATMPRVSLRMATEKMAKAEREGYLGMAKGQN